MTRLSESFQVFMILAALCVGCGGVLENIDDATDPKVAKALRACRAEARAYAQTSANPQSKETAQAAYLVYTRCKLRNGLE